MGENGNMEKGEQRKREKIEHVSREYGKRRMDEKGKGGNMNKG